MRVHHLNCATLRPAGGRMVCHCLLVATDRRLALVDGGLTDLERLGHLRASLRTRRRLTRYAYARLALHARLDPDETAVRQLARLGYSPADVSDVVMTHLDLDHAGALPDFPRARVHVDEAELGFATRVATSRRPSIHRFRYWPYQWAHGPRWIAYGAGGGERWMGFDGARPLDGLPGMLLVPLPGHSPGHRGVAVRLGGERWLLHAADAYFDHRELDPVAPRSPRALAAFQRRLEFDGAARRATRARLRELVRDHAGEVDVVCSHDPLELEQAMAPAGCESPPGARSDP